MTPRVSFVVAARNDNYGGNFLHRMQVFVNVLLLLWAKHALNAELLIVQWNPPAGRARLSDALTWPSCLKPGMVRVVDVPEGIHCRLPNSDRMPMFEYLAKNVGIRRARGEYVLVTNPDLLFSEELIAYLGSEKLSPDRFYRADRYDFRGSVSVTAQAEAALRFARSHVYQVNIRESHRRGMRIKIGRIRRWYSLMTGRWPGSYEGYQPKGLGKGAVVSLNNDNGVYGGAYTNASGDFLLASFESWTRTRGFPEFTDTFTHLDSYGCHQLKALELEQTLLLPPCMIFHADHQRGAQKSRPRVSSDRWQDDLRRIRQGQLGPAINGETWGLADEALPETIVCGESNP